MSLIRYLISAIISCILALCTTLCSTVYAQAPPPVDVDRATKEVDRPIREEAEQKLIGPPKEVPEEEEEEEKAKEEGPKFYLKEITLTGTSAVPASAFRPFIEKYENKEVTIGDLKILAGEIKREYLRKGIIATCVIPQQDIKEARFTLRAVEAKMGELQIDTHGHFDNERIQYYWHLKPGDVLRYDKMNRSVQLMNKNPDRDVNATLHAGKKPETTDVIMEVKTKFPVHGFFSFDREGAVSTGRERTGFGIKHNNLTLADDTLLVGSTFGDHFIGKYVYHSIPVTGYGTSIMYGYSDSHSQPKKEYETFAINSRSQSLSLTMQQDMYKKGEYLGSVSLGMDGNDKVTHYEEAGGTITKDRFRTLRLKSTYIHRFPGCITYITPQLSQGLNLFGARSRNPLSSRTGGSDNNFTKFNLDIQHRRALPLDTQVSLKFKAQLASERLASQEALSLGGIDSVRGYPSGDFTPDWGFQTNVELLIPSFWIPEGIDIPYFYKKETYSFKKSVTGVLFFDHGYGKKRGALVTEGDDVGMASLGAGLRIMVLDKGLLKLEWARTIADKSITETANTRFHFSLNFEI